MGRCQTKAVTVGMIEKWAKIRHWNVPSVPKLGGPAPAVGRLALVARGNSHLFRASKKKLANFNRFQVRTHIKRVNACYAQHNTQCVKNTRECVVGGIYLANMDEKWFKQQQRRVGKTSEDIGTALGRDRTIVSRIYNGRQKMTADQARVFAEVLEVPVGQVLERAGVLARDDLTPTIGFAEDKIDFKPPDAVAFSGSENERLNVVSIAEHFGGNRPGVDVWEVSGAAMSLMGYLTGDCMLVDAHAATRAVAGDVVVAQIYDRRGEATTVLRRFEPPVLVSASSEPDHQRVYVVDGNNVVIRGKVVASWRDMRR